MVFWQSSAPWFAFCFSLQVWWQPSAIRPAASYQSAGIFGDFIAMYVKFLIHRRGLTHWFTLSISYHSLWNYWEYPDWPAIPRVYYLLLSLGKDLYSSSHPFCLISAGACPVPNIIRWNNSNRHQYDRNLQHHWGLFAYNIETGERISKCLIDDILWWM